ncbi:MAG TPA: hypothetical protein O0X97_03180 [Methanocorpusculum sp.]|nr:hypothetical protein [Methanocorpusculum sp.]
MANDENSKKNNKGMLILIIVLLAAILIGGGIFAVYFLTSGNQQPVTGGVGYDPTATDIETEDVKPGVAIPGWSKMTIPANTKEISVDFFNPESNSGYYSMTFELALEDTGEVLFTSGLILPGKRLTTVTLNRALPAGEYNALLTVQPYTLDTQDPTNNLQSKMKLVVTNV